MDPLSLILSIAAGIILAMLILVLWPWILLFLIGGATLLALGLLISSLLSKCDRESTSSNAPILPKSNVELPAVKGGRNDSANLPNTLSEMLRAGPPLIYKVKENEVWFLAATPSTDARTRLYIEIKSDKAVTQTINRIRALELVKGPLCSPEGVLTTYSYIPSDITAVIYQGKTRVAVIDLPDGYCH